MALGPARSGLQEVPTALLHLMQLVGKKQWQKRGEGHPPPSATMVRIGWRSSCITVTTLLGTRMEKYRVEPQEPSDQPCRDLAMMKRCRVWTIRLGDPGPSDSTPGDQTAKRLHGDWSDSARRKPPIIPRAYSLPPHVRR